MIEINKVQTEIFQTEFKTRGSFPSLFDCSDNSRYVVKHSQQERNYRHLINELIAAQLAKIVAIPTPQFALVEINQNILPSNFIYSAGKPYGLGFGSLFLPGTIKNITNIEEIISYAKHSKYGIVEDLIKISAFDIWLRNTDRSVNNPNLLVKEAGKQIRLYAIDHSSIFSELNYLNLEKEVDEVPPVGDNLVDNELFSHLYFNYGFFFNKIKHDICFEISKISEVIIRDIIENIPSEWKLSLEEKEGIFNFINKRKISVENHFNILLKNIGL
ncbi:MAG: HipA family kinase [Ignavibacteriaceae bacterium]